MSGNRSAYGYHTTNSLTVCTSDGKLVTLYFSMMPVITLDKRVGFIQ
jgi:hypothetical protein